MGNSIASGVFILSFVWKVFNRLSLKPLRDVQNCLKTRRKRKRKDEVKDEILPSLVEGNAHKNGNLNEKTNKVKSYHDAIPIIEKYKSIMKALKRNMIAKCLKDLKSLTIW